MKLVFFSVFSALFSGLGLVFIINVYGFGIIQFIFERGAFSSGDTANTVFYLKSLSWSFILMFIATSLIQPFFTLKKQVMQKPIKKAHD